MGCTNILPQCVRDGEKGEDGEEVEKKEGTVVERKKTEILIFSAALSERNTTGKEKKNVYR